MNGDGKLELEIMLRVANSAQLQTLGEVEVDIMASLREHAENGVSVQLTALHANMALGRVLREIANRVDPPHVNTLPSSAPIDDALQVLGDVAVYPVGQLRKLIDWTASHFIDGEGAEYALALRNVANAVHPLRITRASVELVARELSRANQLEVETPSKWDELSDGARHSWLVAAERLLAQL